MAYGNIVGYEPGPADGAYNFTKADGSKMLFAGAAAEDLKAKLDAAEKLGPQKTASLGKLGPANTGQDFVNSPFSYDQELMGAEPPAAAPAPAKALDPLAGFKSKGLGVFEGGDGRLY